MIYLEPIKVQWEPGKRNLTHCPPQVRSMYEDYMAETYVRLIRERVESQRLASQWAPLNPFYLGYKRERGWSLKTWEATGELVKALKVKSGRKVGFDGRKRHKESKVPYITIARANEYGTIDIPARPLFRPVYAYMRRHSKFFFDQFMREGPYRNES